MIKLKTIKTLTKKKKEIKLGGSNWNYYCYCKNKNHKLDLNDKIKRWQKRQGKKKSKVERSNREILYIQIKI
jgi:hypothetical protein